MSGQQRHNTNIPEDEMAEEVQGVTRGTEQLLAGVVEPQRECTTCATIWSTTAGSSGLTTTTSAGVSGVDATAVDATDTAAGWPGD